MEQKRRSQRERCSISMVVLVYRCGNCALCLGVIDTFISRVNGRYLFSRLAVVLRGEEMV